MPYDVIVRDGVWFDGTGAPPQVRTLGIRDGGVAAVTTEQLDETGCPEVIDAAGKWVVLQLCASVAQAGPRRAAGWSAIPDHPTCRAPAHRRSVKRRPGSRDR
jgi:hypothetical protein